MSSTRPEYHPWLLRAALRRAARREQASWAREIHASGSRLHDVLSEILDYVAAAHMAVEGIHSEFTLASILEPLAARFHGVTIESREASALSRRVAGRARAFPPSSKNCFRPPRITRLTFAWASISRRGLTRANRD